MDKNIVNNIDIISNSNNLYKFIAENISDGIIIFDSNQAVEYVSPVYLKQIGYSESEELLKTPEIIYSIMHPDDREAIFANIYKAIELKKDNLVYSYRVKNKKGEYIWREDNAKLMYDETGKYSGACVVCRNVTENKKMAETLLKDKIELQEKLDELEKNYNILIQRELKMVELKKRISELEKK